MIITWLRRLERVDQSPRSGDTSKTASNLRLLLCRKVRVRIVQVHNSIHRVFFL